jgi:hypothetical protein
MGMEFETNDPVMWVIALLTVTACGGSSPKPTPMPPTLSSGPRDSAPCDDRPKGSPADYEPPTLPGFTISAPVTCDREHGAYIRIERKSGARKLGIAKAENGGFSEGCMEPPAPGEDCRVLNFSVPLIAAEEALALRGITTMGHGEGPCADIQGAFAAWNMSLRVASWTEAATALRQVADEMKRYDVTGYVGVSVMGNPCVREAANAFSAPKGAFTKSAKPPSGEARAPFPAAKPASTPPRPQAGPPSWAKPVHDV